MPSSGTLESWVSVNGERLSEYDVQEDFNSHGSKVVTCWIPSESGKEFVVHVKDQRLEDRPTMGWTLTADGLILGKTVMRPGSGPYAMQTNEYTRDDFLSLSGRRKMKFAELELTDDDLVHMTGNAALGEMRVTVYPVNILQRSRIARAKAVDISNTVVHERSKKAGAHIIQHGSASEGKRIVATKTTPPGPTIVEFIFRYRPLSLLQANEIVPLPPHMNSTPPSQTKLSAAALKVEPEDHADSREDCIRRLEEKLQDLKRKRDEDIVKLEPGPSTWRRRVTVGQDVIDLTLDDE